MRLSCFIIFILLSAIACKSKDEWKTRAIYQILTDRFARTSDTGSCIVITRNIVEEITEESLTT